jgi:hypothetical protein
MIFLGVLFVASIERITVSSSEVIVAKYLNRILEKCYLLYDDNACALSGGGAYMGVLGKTLMWTLINRPVVKLNNSGRVCAISPLSAPKWQIVPVFCGNNRRWRL